MSTFPPILTGPPAPHPDVPSPAPGLLIVDRRPAEFATLVAELGTDLRVETATTGHLAVVQLRLAAAGDHSPLPDLVLIDLDLPGIRGLDLLRLIRHTPELRHLQAVMVAAESGPELRFRCAQEGATACLERPRDAAASQRLARALRRLVMRPRGAAMVSA